MVAQLGAWQQTDSWQVLQNPAQPNPCCTRRGNSDRMMINTRKVTSFQYGIRVWPKNGQEHKALRPPHLATTHSLNQ